MTKPFDPNTLETAPMPPEAPLAMPVQSLGQAPDGVTPRLSAGRTLLARLIAFGGGLGVLAYAVTEMIGVVASSGITPLEWAFTALFGVSFVLIACSAASAVAGLVGGPRSLHIGQAAKDRRLETLTALVMPVYREDPVGTTAALSAMADDLAAAGQAHAFEIVILSDTPDADAALPEMVAVDALRARLAGTMPVWYRRRLRNTAKKAGNVGEFVRRWGARYGHMIVLDADSVMSADSLVALAAAMEDRPEVGLIQTVPRLAGGETIFARTQQFAGALYGPMVARGVAAWSGGAGNYWGHNAITRTGAFASACGLPDLKGRAPFGGHILSHDFVEAALLRRAGHEVVIADRIDGSFEGGPPTFDDVAVRDRRWAQGNLQHAGVIPTRGLDAISRAHMVQGILSYVSAPLWFAMILVGLALSIQASMAEVRYFGDGPQLFPDWPQFDAERMLALFAFTITVLLLPKALSLLRVLASSKASAAFGGRVAVFAGALAELAVTTLVAPIMMVVHTRHVADILLGRDSGWGSQRRGAEGARWSDTLGRHALHTLVGLLLGAVALQASTDTFLWLSPILLGLVLAVPLAHLSGSVGLGSLARRWRLFLTPEETDTPAILDSRDARMRGARPPAGSGFEALAASSALRTIATRWSPPPQGDELASERLVAAAKMSASADRVRGLASLSDRERTAFLSSPDLMRVLEGAH